MDHSLKRMSKHACQLLNDAKIISDHQSDRENGGQGEYLLRLMALEILLKAGALLEAGHLDDFGHSFPRLFAAQESAVKESVRNEFGARSLEREGFETGAALEEQLMRLEKNYVRARYLYEPSIALTEGQRVERERAFRNGELHPSEWDIIYHNELVVLILEVLLGRLSDWIPDWFDWAPTGTT